MSFQFQESMVDDFWSLGYTIFRGIVPGTLLRDLRSASDQAREVALAVNGPQAHRLQPIKKYADRVDQKPFQDYCELPALADGVKRLLGDDFTHGHRHIMGILVEPKQHTWCQGWHRDGMVELTLEGQHDPDVIACQQERWIDPGWHTQINCAVYRDATLWYVPGSHRRMTDLAGEVQTPLNLLHKIPPETSEAEFERGCLEHARDFSGAEQILLEPGDFMIYRSNGWHCAHIVKYQPRATIHDVACHHGVEPEYKYHWPDVRQKARGKYGTP